MFCFKLVADILHIVLLEEGRLKYSADAVIFGRRCYQWVAFSNV